MMDCQTRFRRPSPALTRSRARWPSLTPWTQPARPLLTPRLSSTRSVEEGTPPTYSGAVMSRLRCTPSERPDTASPTPTCSSASLWRARGRHTGRHSRPVSPPAGHSDSRGSGTLSLPQQLRRDSDAALFRFYFVCCQFNINILGLRSVQFTSVPSRFRRSLGFGFPCYSFFVFYIYIGRFLPPSGKHFYI